jgi:pantothenate synthetase (EC 6.3.2.1)
MITATMLDALRAQVRGWRQAGQRIAFVPTMGNLHAGHYSLISLARQRADRVVASVFVNPTQFGPNEDFERYPRTPEADAKGWMKPACDVLWLPTVETMYPLGVAAAVNMRVPGVTETLDGAHRPGHFDGVATVVARLFNQVLPDVAYFRSQGLPAACGDPPHGARPRVSDRDPGRRHQARSRWPGDEFAQPVPVR